MPSIKRKYEQSQNLKHIISSSEISVNGRLEVQSLISLHILD